MLNVPFSVASPVLEALGDVRAKISDPPKECQPDKIAAAPSPTQIPDSNPT
jgi:hypothetical protein